MSHTQEFLVHTLYLFVSLPPFAPSPFCFSLLYLADPFLNEINLPFYRNSESHDFSRRDEILGNTAIFIPRILTVTVIRFMTLRTSSTPLSRLEFRYSIQIRITTLYLTQRSHRLLLPPLRSIIRTVHVRHRVILRGTVELTAREISIQSSDLILHLILNANVRRFISH